MVTSNGYFVRLEETSFLVLDALTPANMALAAAESEQQTGRE